MDVSKVNEPHATQEWCFVFNVFALSIFFVCVSRGLMAATAAAAATAAEMNSFSTHSYATIRYLIPLMKKDYLILRTISDFNSNRFGSSEFTAAAAENYVAV